MAVVTRQKAQESAEVSKAIHNTPFAPIKGDRAVKYITASLSGNVRMADLEKDLGTPIDTFQTFNDENTICCVYSNSGMPPVEPRPRTSTFKLTLRRFLRPFTRRSHRPQTPPPTVHTAHHRVGVWRKMGRAKACPCAQKCDSAIWGPSHLKYINMQVSEVLAMC